MKDFLGFAVASTKRTVQFEVIYIIQESASDGEKDVLWTEF